MAISLMCWIGRTDLQAADGSNAVGLGPIAQAVTSRSFDRVILLNNYPKGEAAAYSKWLRQHTKAPIELRQEPLSSPMNFGEIYEAAVRNVSALKVNGSSVSLAFHLSPGTSAMAAVWIILAKTRFPAELLESSKEHGVRTASVPFDISAEFIPDLLRGPDQKLGELSEARAPEAPEFSAIIHRSPEMKRIVEMARRVAVRSVPVLIEGESGTGKELFARAIHASSPRKNKPFRTINCGAIPESLVESILFGHEKGAFTGADKQHKGLFEETSGGTLLLDEIGELPKLTQVKLLRVLQENEVTRLGSSTPIKVDVRLIAATNRHLAKEVAENRFREDLFFRLAVAVLRLPPLRSRQGDVGLLVDRLLEEVNGESQEDPGFRRKKFSAGARNLLITHTWPGNVRELANTLRRLAIWTEGEVIRVEDVREALLETTHRGTEEILNRPLGNGLNLPNLLGFVAQHYLERAVAEAAGNKTKAADLLGLASYQTLTNWLVRYGVER